MWAAVGPAWGENAAFLDARGSGMTARMLELAGPRPGDRVLELACGPGSVGLAAAELVRPNGKVVMSDLVPEMLAIAEARIDGTPNVSTRVLDLDEIDEPDGTYDVVLCRDGLMLAPDPNRAAREIRRVLRPGGRAAVAVWGPRARNPWLGVVFDVVGEQLGTTMPPPGVPNAFSLDDAGTARPRSCRRRARRCLGRRGAGFPGRGLRRGMVATELLARRLARPATGGTPRAGGARAPCSCRRGGFVVPHGIRPGVPGSRFVACGRR